MISDLSIFSEKTSVKRIYRGDTAYLIEINVLG